MCPSHQKIDFNNAAPSSSSQGLRWQFELDGSTDLDEIIATCRTHHLDHEVITERGGERFHRRILTVRSPSGVTVWFEGVNEADVTTS